MLCQGKTNIINIKDFPLCYPFLPFLLYPFHSYNILFCMWALWSGYVESEPIPLVKSIHLLPIKLCITCLADWLLPCLPCNWKCRPRNTINQNHHYFPLVFWLFLRATTHSTQLVTIKQFPILCAKRAINEDRQGNSPFSERASQGINPSRLVCCM